MVNPLLDGILLLTAVTTLAWGFERYRTQFIKSDLILALVLASGLVLFAVIPRVFDYVGGILDIRRRVVVVSLFANLVIVFALLYLGTALRRNRERISELNRSLSVDQAPNYEDSEEFIQVVIPAYNEAGAIRDVLESLPDTVCGYQVRPLVVSDGSDDQTATLVESVGVTVVEHPINQGQGGALKTGFEVSMANDAHVVVTMDGDGQHPAEELERLVEPVLNDEADFVMGSRYKGHDGTGNGVVRQSGIRVFTSIINLLTKSHITDCTNGFRAISGKHLRNLELTEERFSAPELIIEARKNDLRVKEIPIRVEQRKAGETKKPQLKYALGLTRTILLTWIR
jgi:hypothetical protein